MSNNRTHNACKACRDRKLRCDGSQPACQRCLQQGEECVYTGPEQSANGAGPSRTPQRRPAAGSTGAAGVTVLDAAAVSTMTSLNAPLMNAPPANGNFNTMPYNLIPQAPPSGNVAMMGVMGHYMLPWPSLATHESPNHGLVQPSEQHGSGQGGQRQPQAFPQHSGPFSPTPQPLPNSNMNPQQQHQQQQQQQQPWMLHVSPGGPPPPLFVDFNAQFGLAEPAAPASGLLHGLPPFHGPFLSNAPAPNPDNSPGSIGGEHMGQARTVLSSSERSLMNLAIHTALSHGPEARADITAALRSGLSEEQIRAALAYAMEYCNTLACTMAVMTANRVFEEEGPPKDEDGSG